MRQRGQRGRLLSLTAEELKTVRNLIYNVLSQNGWPGGLDVPENPNGELHRLQEVLEKLQS